jgi:DNA-binding transcriptional LysR family regulator
MDFGAMNISQLKALDAAVRTKSYTKAAQELAISQPAVSQQLRELEKQYQVRLIYRRGKQIEFTPLALALVRKARICLTFIKDMEQTLQAEGDLQAGSFRIGLSCHYLVMELLAKYMESFPAVAVNSQIADSETLIERVLDCQLDIAAITALEPDPRVENFLYSCQRIVAVVNHQHPWAELDSLVVDQLQDAPMISRHISSGTRAIFERRLAELDISPRVVLELDSFDAMLEAVVAKIGFAIVLEDEFNGDERLRCVPFSGVEMIANQYLICLPEYKELNAVSSFLNMASEAKVIKQFSTKVEIA